MTLGELGSQRVADGVGDLVDVVEMAASCSRDHSPRLPLGMPISSLIAALSRRMALTLSLPSQEAKGEASQ
jgi:hypothetical protein